MPRDISKYFLAALGYFLCALFSFYFARATQSVAVIWPASGLGLALALLVGRRVILAVWIADFAATVLFAPPLHSLLFASGNALALLAAASAMRRLGPLREFYLKPRGMFVFMASTTLLCLISSLSGAGTEFALTGLTWAETPRLWWLWFVGDFTGVVLFTPLILAWTFRGLRNPAGRSWEFALILACTLLAGFVFLGDSSFLAEGYPVPFIIMPFLIWASFRLGYRELYTLLPVLGAAAVFTTSRGYALFPSSSLMQSYVLLQSYLVVIALLCLIVHCVVSERARAFASALASRDALTFGLADLAETRDQETGAHLIRTQRYVRLLVEGLRERGLHAGELSGGRGEIMVQAAPLHDIGKVGVPDAILRKPGRLAPWEFEEIKRHPEHGARAMDRMIKALGGSEFLDVALEIILGHHEKWDGTGYPRGVAGRGIPLSARLMALADVYDALTSNRVYRPAMSHDQAREIIRAGSGAHFDPDLVDAFLRLEPEFRSVAGEAPDRG